MSERIYAAITDDFARRMRNWARWKSGEGYSLVSSAYGGISGDGWGDRPVPMMEGEAIDTSRALDRVPALYRGAVQQFWSYEEQSLANHAARYGLGAFRLTFESWVITGHCILRVKLVEITTRWREGKGVESVNGRPIVGG